MNIILLRYTNIQIYKRVFQEAASFNGLLITKDSLSLTSGINRNQCKLGLPSYFSTSGAKETSFIEKIKQELTVLKNVDLSLLKSAPVPASLYGFGGILPFVFPPLYFIVGSYSPFLATAQLIYGATILAFVGGVKWGNALAKDNITHDQIGISTVPSLVAWVSLLVPEPLGFLVVSSGLLGALYVDFVSSNYPPWFRAMRFTLTSIATTSLLITFLFNVFH